MSQEQNNDLITLWDEQSFAGKELFRLEDNGTIILVAGSNIKERVVATIAPENADVAIKNLLEKFTAVEARVRELEVEWIATEDKLKLADKVSHLKDYLNKTAALGDFSKLAILVHDWEHTLYTVIEANYAAKLKIAELAESLAESDQWKETAQAFRDIADVWRQAGYVEKQRNDKLWNRIEAAKKAFVDRKRQYHEEEEKDLLVNLDLKLDLVEQAEAIANSNEWKKTTETFHRLTDEWKTIGHTMNKKNEELWQRFLAAKSTFFENKRQHYNLVQAEQEANYAVKLALVERAEAMKDSTNWNETAQAYSALMEEWKKTGRVPQVKADELWKRYTDAQEQFYDAKRKHNEGIKTELNNNYNLKKDILDRVQRLQYSNSWNDATNEINALFEEWKKIGPVPRMHSEKIWEELNAARKNFFNRKDASRELRKQYIEDQKVARIAEAKGQVAQLRKDINEEVDKIADFKVAIENITPGKKAAELRAHLEKLIVEGEANIKRWKAKLALADADEEAATNKKEEEQPAEPQLTTSSQVSSVEPE